jgi:hypothetical protein
VWCVVAGIPCVVGEHDLHPSVVEVQASITEQAEARLSKLYGTVG